VVGVSLPRDSGAADLNIQQRPICDYCGGWIDEPVQRCPALDEGVCRP
jgi:hypothetical protein